MLLLLLYQYSKALASIAAYHSMRARAASVCRSSTQLSDIITELQHSIARTELNEEKHLPQNNTGARVLPPATRICS